ncbi:LamG-like jellyroll fold domain-containing protein [Pedosphaera parvula]|nr:LamG-like jellyroll fold domain-containing protein [Pedosphaera parvula]
MKAFSKVALALTILITVTTSFASDLRLGLISYWPLEADNGGTTPDLSSGNNMTVVGGSTIGAGKVGSGFVFNGTSQYLNIVHDTNNVATGLTIFSAGTFTLAMWVKGSSNQTDRMLFTMSNTTNNNPLVLFQTKNSAIGNTTSSNKLDVLIRNNSGGAGTQLNHRQSSQVVFDNTWHHIAWVDDRGTVKLYVDGSLDQTNFNYTVTQPYTFNTTSIGALVRPGISGFFNGSIDEVAVWERALSQAEVQSLITNGMPQPVTNSPPTFVQQPLSSTNNMGDRLNFSVQVYGQHPYSYQWYKNGVSIPNAINKTYSDTSTTEPATNTYYVVAANPAGSTQSDTATVVIVPDVVPNVTAGLLSYWPLDSVTNSTTLNTPDLYSHNDLQLIAMDGSSLVPGQFGSALNFDANLQQYAVRSSGFPIYNNTNYTVSFWVNAQGLSQQSKVVFAEANPTNINTYFLMGTDTSSSSSMHVKIAPGVDKISTRQVFDATWHHVVWVDENGKGRLYVDGVLDETDFGYTRSSIGASNTTAAALAQASATNFFSGAMDELAVWGRRLSYTEIQAIRTNGIPAPVTAIPPAITIQPVDRTNAVFQGDTVLFGVAASGTSPLSYQWNKNGTAISGATSNVLDLVNVQSADAANYNVVITNSAGSVTSVVAHLTMIPYTPATAGEVLKVDFDLASAPTTFPGFDSLTLTKNGTNFNGVNVTVTGIGASLQDRDRGALAGLPASITQIPIYRDFIYANSGGDANGLRILIERLAPNVQYGLTVWSWDQGSTGVRISDWVEAATGVPIAITNGYTFDGGVNPPGHDFDYTFGGLLTASASGKLQIEGRKDGGTAGQPGVFVNAIRLVAQPIIKISKVELNNNGNIRLTVERQYPYQPVHFENSAAVSGASWGTTATGGIIEEHGPIAIAEFPITDSKMFYRVVAP